MWQTVYWKYFNYKRHFKKPLKLKIFTPVARCIIRANTLFQIPYIIFSSIQGEIFIVRCPSCRDKWLNRRESMRGRARGRAVWSTSANVLLTDNVVNTTKLTCEIMRKLREPCKSSIETKSISFVGHFNNRIAFHVTISNVQFATFLKNFFFF